MKKATTQHREVSHLGVRMEAINSLEYVEHLMKTICEWVNRNGDYARLEGGSQLITLQYRSESNPDNMKGQTVTLVMHAYRGLDGKKPLISHFEPEEKSNIITLNGANHDN